MDKAILGPNNELIACDDIVYWATWFETNHRRRIVKWTGLDRRRNIYVSTVFLGMNHNFYPDTPGLYFETMVFGTSISEYQQRYRDWDSALKGHWEMVSRARQARQVRFKEYDPMKLRWAKETPKQIAARKFRHRTARYRRIIVANPPPLVIQTEIQSERH